MVLAYLSGLRDLQESLMTETCTITREGVVVADDIPCRVHSSRLLAETPDPQDANTRSMSEWGWTMPHDTDVEIGDEISLNGGTLSTIAGEVLHKHDTWAIAIRVWATFPKDAVEDTTIVLKRYNETTEAWDTVGTYDVKIHYDRNLPIEVPVRFSPAARTLYKGGTVAGDLNFPVRTGDRFIIGAGANKLLCSVQMVLPGQPQRIEARFTADISGARI